MFYHEVSSGFNEGKAIRRASWPKSHKLVKAESVEAECSISEDQRKQLGLNANAEIENADNFSLLVKGKNSVEAGYQFTKGDQVAQDWELVEPKS